MQAGRLFTAAVSLTVMLLTACAPTHDTKHYLALEAEIQQLNERQQRQAGHLELIRSHISHLKEIVILESSSVPQPVSAIPLTREQPPETSLKQSSPVELISAVPGDMEYSDAGGRFQSRQHPDAIAYKMAFSALTTSRYADAEALFEHFLRTYRHHHQTANAHYWLANAQASQEKNDLAVANLKQVIVDPNAESKKPAALLLLAQLYRLQGFHDKADESFTLLFTNYPNSDEARQLTNTN